MKWSVEVNLNPAWRAGHVLTVVLCSPTLHKAQAYSTHLGQLKDSLVALRDGQRQQAGKVLVVEDAKAAAGRDLAHSRRVEAVILIAVTTLNKDTRVTQTLCIHLATHVVQMQTCSVQQTTCNKM